MTIRTEDGYNIFIKSVTGYGDVQTTKWSKPQTKTNKGEEWVHNWFWILANGRSYRSQLFTSQHDAELELTKITEGVK